MPFIPDQIKALKKHLAELDEERATIQRMLDAAEKRLDPPYAPQTAPPVFIPYSPPCGLPHWPAPLAPGDWPGVFGAPAA